MTASAVQTITYPISIDYVKGWTDERAISEFVANAIDECPGQWTMSYSGGQLVIEDQGEGIPEEGFILGYSSKDSNQVGQFGEGKKISLLVLARSTKVKDVLLDTVGYSIRPRLVDSSSMKIQGARRATENGVKMLAYDVEASERTEGTRVSMTCPKSLYEKVKARFRHFDDTYTPPAEDDYQLLTDPALRGKIYIGGVLVTEKKDLRFAYDLPLANCKSFQNRDRTVLDAHHLRSALSQALRAITDVATLADFVKAALIGELSDFELQFPAPYQMAPQDYGRWEQVRARIYGSRKVMWASEAADLEAALGLEYQAKWEILHPSFKLGQFTRLMELLDIPKVREAQRREYDEARKPATKYVTRSKLTKVELEDLRTAEATVTALYGPSALGGHEVRIFKSLYKSTYNGFVEDFDKQGLYHPSAHGRISLRRNLLTSFDQTLEILIHECAHRIAHKKGNHDYSDRSIGFERQLQSMAARAASLLVKHNLLDDLDTQREDDDLSRASLQAGKLVSERLDVMDLKTFTAASKQLRVRTSTIKALRVGMPVRYSHMAGAELVAVAAAIGLRASLLALCGSLAEGQALSLTGYKGRPGRGKKGQLTYTLNANVRGVIAMLRADGYLGWADLLESHRSGKIKFELDTDALNRLEASVSEELLASSAEPVELTVAAARERVFRLADAA